MARYIDADKTMEEIDRIGGHNLCEWETLGVKALIDRQPTADVVLRAELAVNSVQDAATIFNLQESNKKLEAEVERLQKILDSYALQYGTVMDKYIVIERARAEVAREIFAEIEEVLNNIGYFDELDFKALKKKYTEGEG